ncbi:MAG: hypothetical protein ACREID_04995, partial [Planctomycetota bacterium]
QGRWASLDAAGRVEALRALEAARSAAVVAQCRAWLQEKELPIRSGVVRVLASCATDPELRPQAEAAMGQYLRDRLDWRARREKEEFEAVVRDFGRKLPPDDVMAAGRGWQDPYDARRRTLPPEILEEREHLRAVVAAIEDVRAASLRPLLLRLFREHHDPEVLVAVVACFKAWQEWSALPDMADLARIQSEGRRIGGRDVIGAEAYDTLRLKWDVHKDRLWWSRPEYVPRLLNPILDAASATSGAALRSCRELDAWLLAHEADLKARGVKLDDDFKARAASTQD